MFSRNLIPDSFRIKTRINESDILRFFFYVFTFFVVFTPVDVYGMKKITLIVLLLFAIRYIELFPSSQFHRIISVFGFWVTGITIIVSSLLTKDVSNNVTQGYMGLILLLFYLIENKKIDYSIVFRRVLFILAVFTIIMAILDITGISPMQSNGILNWMSENEIAYVGKHSGLVTGYMIFIKTSPLLVIAIPSFYNDKHYFSVIICILALLISGTRANIIVGLLSLIIAIVFKGEKSLFEKVLLVVSITGVIAVMINGIVVNNLESMFELKASDDAVRNGTLHSILDGFREDPLSLLIGSGYSSSFYNAGVNAYSTIVELSYWNLLRQVGLFLFLPMLFTFIYPVIKLVKYKNYIPNALAYLGYLIIAYTNPLLYSTTGLIGLLYMFNLVYKCCYSKLELIE